MSENSPFGRDVPVKTHSALSRFFALLAALSLVSCAAIQLKENTSQMASTIEDIRVTQLLTNIADQIDRHDVIPSGVFVDTGTAEASLGGTLSATLPSMNLAKNTRSLTPTVTGSWTDSWSLDPISDPQDLNNLRALYGVIYRPDSDIANFIYATIQLYHKGPPPYPPDDQYGPTPEACGIAPPVPAQGLPPRIINSRLAMQAYFAALKAFPYSNDPVNQPESVPNPRDRHSKIKAAIAKHTDPKDQNLAELWASEHNDCFDPKPSDQDGTTAHASTIVAPPIPGPAGRVAGIPASQAVITASDNKPVIQTTATLNTYFGLTYPTRDMVHDELRNGTSVDCRYYEISALAHQNDALFARWLFWRNPDGSWAPVKDAPEHLVSLGTYNGHEFFTPAPACVSDFMILAISSVANSHAASQATPKSAGQ
jgi:hypothetical protein